MLKYFFAFIMLIHGLIHFTGFAKGFGYGNITQITKDISKTNGTFWLLTAILFGAATVLFLLKKESWPHIAVVAAVTSQILIITVWKDAKFGTIANVMVLLVAIAAVGSQYFEAIFRKDVTLNLSKISINKTDLLTENDIQLLPLPVQKYLRYCNVLNKPKVKNVKVVFNGEMRDKGKDWFKFTAVQYNFFDEPTRLFFMKGKMYGTIVPGYHCYQNTAASMQIKLFGLFNVVNVKGTIMSKAETVTVFNDMCLMAPAALIDERIEWTAIDSLSTKATFTNGANKITATLFFNSKGQLVNFISDDRYAMDMKQYRFSTPVKEYVAMNEIKIWKYGEALWHYPDGEFVYGKFHLKSIEYNVTKL
ncbi:MAG: hypothetical protein H7Y86_09575 [Rhizobacter sp.]|nr:hypothetical protein [Ferruginibacter sp.]